VTSDRKTVRCAIYTRKSSEEGLEQSFNSLDAQREACEAYIISQRHEGWRIVPCRYDDGGYSGGTMQRPALQKLLDDVKSGIVDTIVVYKVDRLTRTLSDFAKIVEALDTRGVSFVSVTQQFNTTSSMGRLTLNVLLSFAQFEREVTGERIRDKIAASKKKGMWMGGFIPLGYDLKERKLVPNSDEAKLVRSIFSLYIELGCVSKLKKRLDEMGIKSRLRMGHTGAQLGGKQFSRGALYELLRNPLYIGEVRHHQSRYPGQHEGIVPRQVWDRVQEHLSSHGQGRKNGLPGRAESLLAGLLQDEKGNRLTPSHTVKNGKRYRYYVCQSPIRDPDAESPSPMRLPAHDIETQILARLRSFLNSEQEVFDRLAMSDDRPAVLQRLVRAAQKFSARWPSIEPDELYNLVKRVIYRVTVHESSINVLLRRAELRLKLIGDPGKGYDNRNPNKETDLIYLQVEAELRRCGLEVRLVVPPGSANEPAKCLAPPLLKALARAHQWLGWVMEGKVKDVASVAQRVGINQRYVAKVFQCAFLAPDIVEAIMDGRQPPELTFERLRQNLPMSWAEQRRQLGF
jgi:site-specific DNA recombinase